MQCSRFGSEKYEKSQNFSRTVNYLALPWGTLSTTPTSRSHHKGFFRTLRPFRHLKRCHISTKYYGFLGGLPCTFISSGSEFALVDCYETCAVLSWTIRKI